MKAEIRYSHKAEKNQRIFFFFPSNIGLGSFYSLCKPWGFFSFSLRMYRVFFFYQRYFLPQRLWSTLKLSAQNDFWADFSAVFAAESISIILQSLRDNISLLYDYVI